MYHIPTRSQVSHSTMERSSLLAGSGILSVSAAVFSLCIGPPQIQFRFQSTSFSTERRERPTGVFSAVLDGHRLPAGRLSGNRVCSWLGVEHDPSSRRRLVYV
ncbi:hypothetical protein C8R44DRAFT_859094 [Mycena epipterygia]|nr:hypothetical protein C8R44DRAFT_859094 [Mycena epipterygia]